MCWECLVYLYLPTFRGFTVGDSNACCMIDITFFFVYLVTNEYSCVLFENWLPIFCWMDSEVNIQDLDRICFIMARPSSGSFWHNLLSSAWFSSVVLTTHPTRGTRTYPAELPPVQCSWTKLGIWKCHSRKCLCSARVCSCSFSSRSDHLHLDCHAAWTYLSARQ